TSQHGRSASSPSGFFQLAGIRPGRYTLTFQAPNYPPHAVDVDVPVDSEVYLDGVELPPYLEVGVVVAPPLDPAGRPWKVSVTPRLHGARQGRPLVAFASAEGRADLAKVTPGHLEIDVLTRDGNRLLSHEEDVTTDAQISLDVPTVKYDGRIHRGSSAVKNA